MRYHWVIDPNDEDPQNNNNPIDSTISHDEEIADTEDAEDSYEDADITITSPKNAVQPGQTLTVKGSNLPPSKKFLSSLVPSVKLRQQPLFPAFRQIKRKYYGKGHPTE